MWSRVKINEISKWVWFAYFTLTLTMIGLILAYCLVAPFYLLGFVVPQAKALADWIMVRGIRLLMEVQPWFNAHIDFDDLQKGCLLVSNHRSHLDAFILLSRVEGVKILAKESLFSIPGLGFIMWVSGQIPLPARGIDSIFRAMHTVKNYLKKGETVHIFPEMTRCRAGFIGTHTFSLAPFQIAYQEGIPVLPIVFKGTDAVWPKGQVGINFGKPIKAFTLEIVNPKNFKSTQDLRDEVQRRIEKALL